MIKPGRHADNTAKTLEIMKKEYRKFLKTGLSEKNS